MKSKAIDEDVIKVWKLPNGLCHREDGPGYETSGTKSWYLNSIEYTEKNYKIEMRSKKLNKLLNH